MQLAVSLTPSCRCLLSSCRCCLSSCSCFLSCSKSDTWPSSLLFSCSIAAALHSASCLPSRADWLSAWRRAISCRQRALGSQVTGSCTDTVDAANAGTWYTLYRHKAVTEPLESKKIRAKRLKGAICTCNLGLPARAFFAHHRAACHIAMRNMLSSCTNMIAIMSVPSHELHWWILPALACPCSHCRCLVRTATS